MQFCQLMQKKQAKTSVCRLLCDFYPLFRLKKAVSLMMQDRCGGNRSVDYIILLKYLLYCLDRTRHLLLRVSSHE
jgi:hypothetical protein